jgi:tRNA nucleotidyltransferase (CCA-adding enzyme)
MMMTKKHVFSIPKEVSHVPETLEKAGFQAYLVGGCVRDLIRGEVPKDWDVNTNATPEQIQELFDETFYENDYGTVGIVNETNSDSLKVIEVTPYRSETHYSNSRHPDSVEFSDNIDDDLKRRDFTVNSIAYNISKGHILDPYKGQVDIEKRTIRAVGDPNERFKEDALRIMRAVRLSAELHFSIDPVTEEALKADASWLDRVSRERIRDEFMRILMSDRPMEGLLTAQSLGILKYISPDLERGIGIDQNQAHKYDVFEHNMRTLQHAADKGWDLDIRLSSLFHDVSKPETRRFDKKKNDYSFHNHDVVGAKLTKKILMDLKFPNKTVDKVVSLVRWHMFFSDPELITLSAVRRMVRNVGKENIWHLINLRVCDRIGTGRPKEQPFRLRKYKSMIEEVLRDPISVGMLEVNGHDVIKIVGGAGPKVGNILNALLEEVLDDPKKNTRDNMLKRVKDLSKWDDEQLVELGSRGRQKQSDAEAEEIAKLREKHWVK